MEARARYTLVGVVVTILTVAAVAAGFWLSTAKTVQKVVRYQVFFHDQSVEGLQTESSVTMKGIRVGNVESSEISKENIEQIRVVIRLREGTPVKEDTRAVIRRNILTGLAEIDLIKSSQQSPLLAGALYEGGNYPVIREGVSEFRVIADSVPNLMEKGGLVFDSIRTFFGEENRDSVQKTLANFEILSSALASRDKQIVALVDDTSKLARDLRVIGDALAKATADDRLLQMGRNAESTLEKVAQVADTLDHQFASLGNTFSHSANSFIQEFSNLATSFSQAAQNISAAVERFDEPRSVLLGPDSSALGPGEIVPKKK